MRSVGFAAVIFMLISLGPAVAQEGQKTGVFGVDVTVGTVGIDTFEENEFAFMVAPSYTILSPCARPNPPKWCEIRIYIPIIRIPGPYPDPWVRILIELPGPGPGPDPRQLEVGPTWIVTPSVEILRSGVEHGLVEHGWVPSLFLGAGFQHDSGETTEIAGLGAFRTAPTNSPAITYGGALNYRFRAGAALRLEVRGVTAFMDTMDVVGPQGSLTLEGGTMTSVFLSAGGSFRF